MPSSVTMIGISVLFGLVCITFYNVNIKKFINESKFNENFNYRSISRGTGAEDLNLMQLQKNSPLSCNIVLNTMGISPHLPMSLRFLYGDSVDKFMFGEDEATIKSPWNIYLYILSPGYLASQYIKAFFDTNYYLSLVLYVSWLFSDLEFWLEISMFISGYYIVAVQSYLLRLLYASVVAFLLYLSHSYVQGIGSFGLEDFGGVIVFFLVIFTLRSFGAYSVGQDIRKQDTHTLPIIIGLLFGVCFHLFSSYLSNTIFYVSLFATPIYSLYKIKSYIDGFKVLFKDAKLKGEVVDPEKAAIVKKFLLHTKPDKLWSDEEFNKLYSVGYTTLGKGGFGTVTLGTKLATNEQVAIKYLHINLKHDIPQLCAGLVKCALEGNKNISDKISEALFNDLLAAAKIDYNMNVKYLLHELKALHAIKLLKSDGLLKLHTAHVLDGPKTNPSKSYMVLSIIEPLGNRIDLPQPEFVRDMNTPTKLSVIQTFFAALAELHSVGIVHRDIKPENVAVSRTNMKQAVIFDLGICLLPHTDDIAIDCLSQPIMSPDEIKRAFTNDKSTHVFDRLVKGAIRNESGDCWAAALVAIHVITGGISAYKVLNPSIYSFNDLMQKWIGAASAWDSVKLDEFMVQLQKFLPKDMPGNGKNFLDIIKALLTPRNSDRMSMKAAMSHKYFSENKIGTYSQELKVAEVYDAVKYDAMKKNIHENAVRDRSNSLAILRNLLKQGKSLSTAVMSDTLRVKSVQADNYISKLLELSTMKSTFTLTEFTDLLSESKLAEILAFDAETLYKLFDYENANSVDRHELLAALLILITPLATESTRLKLVFRAFDVDNNSKLDSDEFRLLLEKYVLPLRQYDLGTGVDIQSLFTAIDSDKSGSIDFEEFIAGIRSNQMLRDTILGEN